VLSQTKTLFTAGFVVTLLGRRLSKRQWTALIVLSAGIAVVNLAEVCLVVCHRDRPRVVVLARFWSL